MIEYVVMDYDGKAVSIEDGTMYYWDADDGQHWDSETLQFEDDEYVACGYVVGGVASSREEKFYDTGSSDFQ